VITDDATPATDELALEIGQAAWSVGGTPGGTAGLSAPEPQRVRLVRVADCTVLAELDADPGTSHAITVSAEGSAEIEPRGAAPEGGGVGPLERREPVDCP
jgi:hypothetical protein